jgi:hypothetical protein
LAGSEPIWLPYAITVGGQIIQIFDPVVHIPKDKTDSDKGEKLKTAQLGDVKVDKRWALFQQPAVMTGGELTLAALDLRFDPIAKTYEAPLQLKANGGMLLIEDFGRQPVRPQDLLNRWIVPLETGIDYLRLQSGQTLQVPFRQLIVFSTNLDPRELVDAAFLRRIQMKVQVGGPDEKMFYQILGRMCQAYNVPFDKEGFLHLLRKWYQEPRRPMQSVHPRDIIKTILSIWEYESLPPRMTPELIDEACAAISSNRISHSVAPRRTHEVTVCLPFPPQCPTSHWTTDAVKFPTGRCTSETTSSSESGQRQNLTPCQPTA